MYKKSVLSIILTLTLGTAIFTGCFSSSGTEKIDLNSMSLDKIIEEAKKEGRVDSVGMPDSWANWGDTWKDINEIYGLVHTDVDMSSAEELAVFESEKNDATKDIGDVGQSFGPVAVEKGLTIPYKTSNWDDIPDWAKDDDGNWIIAYYGTISIITNTKLVPNPPKSFEDILKGDYVVSVGDVTKASQAQNAVLAAAIANGGSESNIQPGIDYFKNLAEQGRLDKGELSLARLEKGEIAVALLWDYNALGYKDQFMTNNPNASFEVNVPLDGSIQSGYCTVINAYTKRPHAAALAREYILSDEGQINLAIGYAKPVRSSVVLPEEVAAKMISNEQYVKARMVSDMDAWAKTAETLGVKWQEEVIAYAK
ncbi:MAG: ABC transporter substrate-binding protein [Firmicutes bacterium HGW-Firmicutes-7]|nr:MAG: ABC transporter substrate-binding protein [Firmicutes bacterium HGW-Firmicutes-7]